MCQRLASWRINDGPGIEDYTLACDHHVGALRSATTTHADVIPEEFPCCYAETDVLNAARAILAHPVPAAPAYRALAEAVARADAEEGDVPD